MENKEQTIEEAALRLFHRHGYTKVTMMDIAEASGMSRPSLYSAFRNKEAIFAALMERHGEKSERDTQEQVARRKNLSDKLECIFDIWIIQPFASVIDSENGADLLANTSTYAPEAAADLYARFERQLVGVLKPEMSRKRGMATQDLAHILMMATKGLKASTATLAELRRMTDGLIAMAVATVGKS
ncbi:MAG: TetR/AcrR family transcriptional regulator [Anaerolineae bacterium]|nr:TetR/AcrR family transcriptional regulator [Gemmatimonadaceae bacterium]